MVVDDGDTWDYNYVASPGKKKKGEGKDNVGDTKNNPFEIPWVKPATKDYKSIVLAPPDKVSAARKQAKVELSAEDIRKIKGSFEAKPTDEKTLGDITIGVSNPMSSKIKDGYEFQAKTKTSGNSRKDKFNGTVARWGYNRNNNLTNSLTDGDHVMEKQLGGPDSIDNVWPLESGVHRSSGFRISHKIQSIKAEHSLRTINDKWFKLKCNK